MKVCQVAELDAMLLRERHGGAFIADRLGQTLHGLLGGAALDGAGEVVEKGARHKVVKRDPGDVRPVPFERIRVHRRRDSDKRLGHFGQVLQQLQGGRVLVPGRIVGLRDVHRIGSEQQLAEPSVEDVLESIGELVVEPLRRRALSEQRHHVAGLAFELKAVLGSLDVNHARAVEVPIADRREQAFQVGRCERHDAVCDCRVRAHERLDLVGAFLKMHATACACGPDLLNSDRVECD
mmetsp:Transcript_22161/g.57800  ORF Transcript_22161/g.57800 Transcript_22161/m.57800 type:complete len:237 (-) Transcript_22161:4987-5697(-)